MQIIFVLILISLVLAAGFLLSYLWAAREGQFDDDYTPAVRMLFDDARPQGRASAAAAPQTDPDEALPDDQSEAQHTLTIEQ
ncbi:MAG: cbb3-type cytochrome oxidase assembly protein CcoS [Saprospiraceae bacterium]